MTFNQLQAHFQSLICNDYLLFPVSLLDHFPVSGCTLQKWLDNFLMSEHCLLTHTHHWFDPFPVSNCILSLRVGQFSGLCMFADPMTHFLPRSETHFTLPRQFMVRLTAKGPPPPPPIVSSPPVSSQLGVYELIFFINNFVII